MAKGNMSVCHRDLGNICSFWGVLLKNNIKGLKIKKTSSISLAKKKEKKTCGILLSFVKC